MMQALVSQICWSDDYGIAMACDEASREQVYRGPWAGDRFGIVPLENMESLKPDIEKKWKDVTEGVDKLLLHLWKHDLKGEAV